ncbi:hypothetical protein LTR01_007132 [Friedmanniomyces endolithicus]|nr:hypothetical protein LTR01_007132 [Friedmanniomyces endolithicus]KAK0832922.1 hypothetical protein LTR73_002009 [Friedmanniomyces endolithicus]
MHDADIPLEDPYPGDTKDTGGPSQATAIEVVWWMMAPTGLWSSRSDAVYEALRDLGLLVGRQGKVG